MKASNALKTAGRQISSTKAHQYNRNTKLSPSKIVCNNSILGLRLVCLTLAQELLCQNMRILSAVLKTRRKITSYYFRKHKLLNQLKYVSTTGLHPSRSPRPPLCSPTRIRMLLTGLK